MFRPDSLRQELLATGVYFLLLWGVCKVAGLSYWLLALAAGAYLFWHIYHLWKLVAWLDGRTRRLPADSWGAWGDVYYRLEVKRRKAAKRKKEVGRLLKQFKSSTRALPDATIVLDNDHNIQWLNNAATQILGVRKSDVGQPVTNLLRHPDFRQYLQDGKFKETLQLKSQHGHDAHMSLVIVPFERKQYLLLARDITQEYRLESMRRDFVSNASHELRTPLSVLQGSIEQMEADEALSSSFAGPLARMRRQSERMMQILQDLLTLARLEGRNVPTFSQDVNLSGLVHEVAEEARISSGEHEVVCEVEPGIQVQGEYEDMHTTLSNLVMNAVRYTPPDGTISIALFAIAAGVRFEVSDTGVGILPQHLPRLTERFYRVDVGRSREAGGTGLGLSIVKHQLEQYRARLEISSEPGVGSTFGFTLPLEFVTSSGDTAQQASAGT